MTSSPRRPHASKPGSRSVDKTWSPSRILRATGLLKVASNPVRLEILVLLGGGDWAVSCLVTEFEVYTPQAISHHLSFLRVASLVEYRTVGSARIYRLTESGGRVVQAVGGLSGAFCGEEMPGP